jgi:hypothetical protein
MTDNDVQREIEANERRDADAAREADDDPALVDAAETVINPLVNVLNDDPLDADEAERLRRQNDADQR